MTDNLPVYAVMFGRDDNGNIFVQATRQNDDKPYKIRDCPDCQCVPLFYPEYKVWMYFDAGRVDAETAGNLIDIAYQNGDLSDLIADAG